MSERGGVAGFCGRPTRRQFLELIKFSALFLRRAVKRGRFSFEIVARLVRFEVELGWTLKTSESQSGIDS